MNEITLITPPPGVTSADYGAIEDAVMETARGRWFLLEYARRQRAAETQRLADAVDRLENAIAGMAPQDAPALPAPETAPGDETATAVAERLSDIVWTMRERGVGDQFCAELEKQIRIIRTMRVELQTAQAAAPPLLALAPPAGQAHEQPEQHAQPEQAPAESEPSVVAVPRDVMRLSPGWPEADDADEIEETAEIDDAPAVDPRLVALARLDALPLVEKIAMFC